MSTPALYDVEIGHVRAAPVRHTVRHRGYLWFVDLVDLPGHGALARFVARDHVGDPGMSLRANVEAFLAGHGIDLDGGAITMLTQPRAFGYVFNPLTLYWCHDPSGTVVAVVAEVHNTYRQRYRYLLRPDDSGRAETEKRFYVSPFYPVDGYYRMSLPEPGQRLAVTVTLHRPGERPFTATVRGVRRPASRGAVLAAAIRYPLQTWQIRALIAAHGLALWAKGLPVHPRPTCEVLSMTAAHRLAALVGRIAGTQLPVRIRAWDGSEAGPEDGPVLVIRSRRALRRLLWAPGELGLARAYVTGEVDVDGDLADALRRAWALAGQRPQIAARHRFRAALTAARLGAFGPPPRPPACEARLIGRLHTRGRDHAAIAHHYDLSNDFYRLLLDDTMAYSAAYFETPEQSLADAQRAKLDLICRKLDLQPGARLLDVGCGWGALLLHAAEHYGVQATGITLSAQQRDLVTKRIADRGLSHQVDVRLLDYRDATGEYDAVASIEMGEHVGEAHYPRYASVLYQALRPGGRLLLQQMSRRAGTAPGGGPFIESYIAPDMHMRPLSQTLAHLETAGFEIRDVHAMREHYVRTVAAWTRTLEARWEEVVALVGEQTARVWRLYLVGGALAFEQGRMGVDQILAVRPGDRPSTGSRFARGSAQV